MIFREGIEKYCDEHSSLSDPLFRELEEETRAFAPKVAHMQVGTIEGRLLSLLTRLSGATRILEFGTFTGCSSLHFLKALPDHGKLTTLDIDEKAVSVARKFWSSHGWENKVESLVQDAHASVSMLIDEVDSGKRPLFDLAFIDADKSSYEDYFRASMKLVKKGGLIIVDNTLWSGDVLNPQDKAAKAIHAFNEARRTDSRVESLLLPIRDGVSLFQIL
jgi:caffeoyl-CoA O-methyltransferase